MEHTEKDGISVIIPVYNAQRYLRRAVDSVLAQTYKDIELILVNDGSKDNSLEICREYEKQDDRVVVIDKENGGVSSARNAGIERATMKYVAFMDNDDYMIPTHLETIYKYISEGYDLLVANAFHIKECDFDKDMALLKDNGRDNVKAIKASSLDEIKKHYVEIQNLSMHWTVWNMLFVRKKIIDNKIRFQDIFGEDGIFSLQYVLACNSIIALTEYRGYVWITRNDTYGKSHEYLPDLNFLVTYDGVFKRIIKKIELKDDDINGYLHGMFLAAIKRALIKGTYQDTYVRRKKRLLIMKDIVDKHFTDRIIMSKLSFVDRILFAMLKRRMYYMVDFCLCVFGHKMK